MSRLDEVKARLQFARDGGNPWVDFVGADIDWLISEVERLTEATRLLTAAGFVGPSEGWNVESPRCHWCLAEVEGYEGDVQHEPDCGWVKAQSLTKDTP